MRREYYFRVKERLFNYVRLSIPISLKMCTGHTKSEDFEVIQLTSLFSYYVKILHTYTQIHK